MTLFWCGTWPSLACSSPFHKLHLGHLISIFGTFCKRWTFLPLSHCNLGSQIGQGVPHVQGVPEKKTKQNNVIAQQSFRNGSETFKRKSLLSCGNTLTMQSRNVWYITWTMTSFLANITNVLQKCFEGYLTFLPAVLEVLENLVFLEGPGEMTDWLSLYSFYLIQSTVQRFFNLSSSFSPTRAPFSPASPAAPQSPWWQENSHYTGWSEGSPAVDQWSINKSCKSSLKS